MPNLHKVFRVEHKSKKLKKVFAGPYSVSGVSSVEKWCESELNLHGDDTHPNPYSDKLLKKIKFYFSDGYHCGFKNIKQLKKWFTKKEMQKLSDLGFIVAQYESDHVLIGDRQVLFMPQNKRIVYSKRIY